MQGLTGIFLEMCAGNPDAFLGAILKLNIQMPQANNRQLILGDLIALGQVRIEIILAGKNGAFTHLCLDSQTKHGGHTHGLLVKYRQYTGHTQIDGTGLSIGLGTIGRG